MDAEIKKRKLLFFLFFLFFLSAFEEFGDFSDQVVDFPVEVIHRDSCDVLGASFVDGLGEVSDVAVAEVFEAVAVVDQNGVVDRFADVVVCVVQGFDVVVFDDLLQAGDGILGEFGFDFDSVQNAFDLICVFHVVFHFWLCSYYNSWLSLCQLLIEVFWIP